MVAPKQRADFLISEEGVAVTKMLQAMSVDPDYSTQPSYSSNAELYPDHSMPFIDKHLEYLRTHPAINTQHYLANLRLITRLH